MKQVDGMNAPRLADAIDAPDSLFEPQGIPRQLQVDHEPAAMLKVQALASRVGGEQHLRLAGIESIDRASSRVDRQPTVNDVSLVHRVERGSHRLERVPIFGEEDDGFAEPADEA